MLISGVPVTVGAEIDMSVSAASAVLMEADSGRILYQKDAHTPRAMASTTKIMTALLGVERLEMQKDITVTPQAVMVEGTALGLRGGDKISALDLITGLILVSGNDAANVLATEMAGSEEAFAKLMNQRAAELGMTHTKFVTPSGLDKDGHSSTAYDMALLAREALKNETLAPIFAMKSAAIRLGDPKRLVTVSNHNRLLKLYPDAIGMKTGFTKKAGRCLVSAAQRDGVTFIAVTLNCPDDWDDHMNLYNKAFSLVENVDLPAAELPALRVAGGQKESVPLTVEAPPQAKVMQGDADRIQVQVDLPGFIWAGVDKGETVGWVKYRLDGQEIVRLPVKTAQAADERPVASYSGQLWRLFGRMLEGLLTW